MGAPAAHLPLRSLSRSPVIAELIFETHATSVDNELGIASGHYDAPLSERGEAEARALGARYAQSDPAVVYCSDLQRSWRTAEIAFAERLVEIVRTPLLRECDYGELSRHPAAEVEAERRQHVRGPYPGGESYADVVERVRAFLDGLKRGDAVVVVIGHRAIHYALQHLLAGVPLADAVAGSLQWRPGWRYRI